MAMKFFTLDLYHRFNSPDVDEAVRADADWEDAIVRYKNYLQTYRDELPPGAKKLAEEVNLHDAEVLGRDFEYLATGFLSSWVNFLPQPPVQVPYTIVSQMAAQLVIILRVGDEINVILYSLWNGTEPKLCGVRPATNRLYWLYDEIVPDQERPRHFWHSILFSDESTLEVPFIDCVYLKFDAQRERKSKG
jgi:hypothetical protein